jgi:hypothetical protein
MFQAAGINSLAFNQLPMQSFESGWEWIQSFAQCMELSVFRSTAGKGVKPGTKAQ